MTKKQLKEAYTNWNREITKLGERKSEIFKELQGMCAEKGDGNRAKFTTSILLEREGR